MSGSVDRSESLSLSRRALLRAGIGGTALVVAPAWRTAAFLFVPSIAMAGGLDAISAGDAGSALKLALEKGSAAAIGKLGQAGGFQNNPKVRIPLPDTLRKSEKLLRSLGKGDDLDALQTAMNVAAEKAVPGARKLMSDAVKSMSVTDAKKILSGPDDSVTQFFRSKTSAPLGNQFLPIVSEQVSKLGIAKQYNSLASGGSKLGLLKGDATSIESFVTAKALDGLYAMVGDEERALRANPLQAGSDLLGRVFGAMK